MNDVQLEEWLQTLARVYGELMGCSPKRDGLVFLLRPERPLAERFGVVAVGGTFDHLHAGHIALLQTAAVCCTKRIVVGLTVDVMLRQKQHRTKIQSYTEREEGVRVFLDRVKEPAATVEVFELSDPLGPTVTMPEIEALVISEETAAGGDEVNRVRVERGLAPLRIITVPLLCVGNERVCSTNIRARL